VSQANVLQSRATAAFLVKAHAAHGLTTQTVIQSFT
jgi:hypothetical protein